MPVYTSRVARILFVSGTSPDVRQGSGTFVGISVLRQALEALGHRVDFLAPSPGRGPVSLQARVAFNLRARSRVARDERAFDAIVGFDLDGVFLRRGVVPRFAAIKGVTAEEAAHERGPARVRLIFESFLEARHARGADRVIATSAHSARRIRQDYGVDASRIAIVPEPIDLARWNEALARVGPPHGIPGRVLCVAHLYPRKNVGTLLDALARLPSDVRLRLVGTGPELDVLERSAAALGILPRVDFLGHVSFEALANEYRSASIFCLPSRQEGFGIVFLEAMAAGLPIVASRAAAVPEIVANGICGTLVEPGDAPGFAAAIAGLFADPVEARRLGEGGRDRVRAYDAPRVALQFLEALGL